MRILSSTDTAYVCSIKQACTYSTMTTICIHISSHLSQANMYTALCGRTLNMADIGIG